MSRAGARSHSGEAGRARVVSAARADLRHVLRTARRRRGLTQDELARRLATTRTTISRWERGRARPRLQRLRILVQVLGLPAEKLPAHAPRISPARARRIAAIGARIANSLARIVASGVAPAAG